MYSHDCVWEWDSLQDPDGISGTGIHALLSCGYEGQCGLHAKDLCRANLAGDDSPSGTIQGEPIANTWLYAVDWAGPQHGDIVMILTDLPAGRYELLSYHNWWEPGPGQHERNCLRCETPMPPMPSVTVHPLPAAVPGLDCKPPGKDLYRGLGACGTGTGVTAIQNAYNVPVTYSFLDSEVSTSLVDFETDGSEVLVIYEAPNMGFADCARPGREGGRGILNAFELTAVEVSRKASRPDPVDGAEGVEPLLTLSWKAAPDVISHDVYFGTSRSDVLNAGPGSAQHKGNYRTELYNPAGLALATKYYWRIDEVARNGSVIKGDLWSFTTAACLYADDFDYPPPGSCPPDPDGTWNGYGGGEGDYVYRVCACGTDTYGDQEVMPSECDGQEIFPACRLQFHQNVNKVLALEYFNFAYGHSEAGLTFKYPQDWTGEPEYLAVFVKGRASDNVNDRLYMVIEDALGGTAEVPYGGPSNVLTTNQWQPWAARLDAFGGVDLSRVQRVYLGVGQRGGSGSGASGVVFFDDLGVCVPGCYDRFAKHARDYNADCNVNFEDHAQEPAVTGGNMLQYRDFAAAWLENTLWP
jgi:hypothetical protein